MPHALLQLLRGRQGHFALESGFHAESWFDLDQLFDSPAAVRPYVEELAARLARHRIDCVCGPETGGAVLARRLGAVLNLPTVATRRCAPPQSPGLFSVRYALPDGHRASVAGQRVAIVDDAISAGSAIRGTHAELVAAGAAPVVVGALIVFGSAAEAFAGRHDLPLEGIARADFDLWLPTECPQCRRGIPLERVSDAPA